MPPLANDIFSVFGHLLQAIGFLIAGLALGRLVFDHVKLATWQVHVALILGLIGLLIGLTAFSSSGSAGALALGVGLAYFMIMMPGRYETTNTGA